MKFWSPIYIIIVYFHIRLKLSFLSFFFIEVKTVYKRMGNCHTPFWERLLGLIDCDCVWGFGVDWFCVSLGECELSSDCEPVRDEGEDLDCETVWLVAGDTGAASCFCGGETCWTFLFSQIFSLGGGAGTSLTGVSSLWSGETGVCVSWGSSLCSSPPENTSFEWLDWSLSLLERPCVGTEGPTYQTTEMSIMCQHLPDSKFGRLAHFIRLTEFLADLM